MISNSVVSRSVNSGYLWLNLREYSCSLFKVKANICHVLFIRLLIIALN